MWTQFWDMHSGGGQKEDWGKICIEAPEAEARIIFFNRFGHNPDRVTCTCCGPDYSVSEEETLEELTAFHRNCAYAYFRPDGTECPKDEAWAPGEGRRAGYTEGYVERTSTDKYSRGDVIPLAEYTEKDGVLVIPASEISMNERVGSVPAQGYVWVD